MTDAERIAELEAKLTEAERCNAENIKTAIRVTSELAAERQRCAASESREKALGEALGFNPTTLPRGCGQVGPRGFACNAHGDGLHLSLTIHGVRGDEVQDRWPRAALAAAKEGDDPKCSCGGVVVGIEGEFWCRVCGKDWQPAPAALAAGKPEESVHG